MFHINRDSHVSIVKNRPSQPPHIVSSSQGRKHDGWTKLEFVGFMEGFHGISWDVVKFHGANPVMCYIAIEHGHWNHL